MGCVPLHMGLCLGEVPAVNPSGAFGASSLWQGSLAGSARSQFRTVAFNDSSLP